jgi:CPA2 family monovalent cation:H+ antiporter-2
MELLSDAFVYLCAAVIAVPIANRLGLGSVLGYLIAGVVIGPVLGIVGSETTEVQHFAEFGVVMMLFLVGLELQPAMLWKMRKQLIGLGGLQVLGTTAVFAGAGLAFGLVWQSAVALGMILALSSTAIVCKPSMKKAG